ncbi:extracellular solute-binding protein [Occultella glacieicola]|uniref:Extracellular solute-binding protein n=1 Tax=Occultella glacieicola TaxID=2518684 RepID=A0ABY2DYJ2_9MICO|nr:extracellular solute-binding protein [Occultella glacieicola]TDE89551.1 extracellular solute-binding protein [Occultella glacieicola]
MSQVGKDATGRFHRLPRTARLSVALVGTAALALLTACGGDDGDPPSAEDVPSEGPIAITWYGSDARNAAVQQVVDNWSAENPDVQIETQPTTFDSYWDRVSVQAAADNIACVAAMQSRYQARYEDRGNLLALDGLIEDGTIDVSGIPEVVLESQRAADGHIYVIPYGIWFEGATLNVPRLAEFGQTPPDASGSWVDYVDWALGAQPSMPEGTWAIADRGDQITQFQAYALGQGETLFGDGEVGFSEETLTSWFDLWTRAVDGGAAPPPDVNAEYAGVPTTQSLMAVGGVLVSSTGDNNISDVQIALDQNGLGTVSIVASPTDGVPQVVGANGWSISANCTNVAASADFISSFVNTPENATILETQTGLPPVTSVLEGLQEDPEVSQAIKDRIALYFDLLDQGATVDVWPDGAQALVSQIATSYQEVAFGQTSSQSAAADFIAQANAALSGF